MLDFARFDQRCYTTVPVQDGYRRWVHSYEDTVEDIMDLALLDRVESVDWSGVDRAADLGCGTGRIGRWLAGRGIGDVDGVDATAEMMALAHESGVYTRLSTRDVRDSGLAGASYDLVVSSLVDEHLPDLGSFYAEARRLLRAGGAFVVVGYHPFFIMANGVPTHFETPGGEPVAIETYIHLPSEHIAAARRVGFVAEELHEGLIDDEWVRRKPKWERFRDWPISFVWVWRTAG